MPLIRHVTVLLAAFATVSLVAGEDVYTFSSNGREIKPHVLHLQGAAEVVKPGDLVSVGGVLLTLGDQRKCDFVLNEDKGVVRVKAPGGDAIVGVKVTRTYENDKRVVVNALNDLNDEQIRALWGIKIDHWDANVAAQLARIDPVRTCLTLTDDAAAGEAKALPSLPANLRCLYVDESSNSGIKDYSGLRAVSGLEFFWLRAMTVQQFDVSLLEKCTNLKVLNASMQNLVNVGSLGAFTKLHTLDLHYCEELIDISFTMTPGAGLKKLQELDANQSKVRLLPGKQMPALKVLRIMSTGVNAETAAAFEKANPQTRVEHAWMPLLQGAVKDASRIRVRSGAPVTATSRKNRRSLKRRTGRMSRHSSPA